jgi:hypothetical protein
MIEIQLINFILNLLPSIIAKQAIIKKGASLPMKSYTKPLNKGPTILFFN